MSGAALEVAVRLPLDRFALDVELATDARRVGVFGPSGAGKSSLLECIAGWRRPHAGRVVAADRVLYDTAAGVDVPRRSRRVGYVPQDALLFPHWTVHENLRAAGSHDVAREARAIEVLELTELLDRRPVTLSGGELRRAALARALCSDPALLLLDEPLGALDRPLRRRILPYLIRVVDEFEVPLLFVSHDATEVQALCEHVWVLDRGVVVAEGTPAEVLAREAGTGDFENVLAGDVLGVDAGTAELDLGGGAHLRVPRDGLAVGGRALVGLRAEDLLVARERVTGLSARNVLPARVRELVTEGAEVVLRAALGDGRGPVVSVLLTAESTAELELEAGAEVWLLAKTRACHVLGAV